MTANANTNLTASQVLSQLSPVAYDSGEIFSGKKSGKQVYGYQNPTPFSPKINPDYIFHESMRDLVVWFMSPPEPLYIHGPTGSGKTSLVSQLAARLRYPVFEVTGHSRLEFSDLVGHLTVTNGTMSMQYGPLALAMRYGGLLLLNEIDITDPSTLCGLNSILDGSPLCIAENGGELICPHPMFRFVATANSNGNSDETGLYQGVLRQNLAFMDRFMVTYVGYPNEDAELALLTRAVPNLPPELADGMIKVANSVRESFMRQGSGPAMEVTMSTRTLIRWADLTLRYYPLATQGIKLLEYALDRALGFRATEESRHSLHEMLQRIIPQSLGESRVV